MIIPQETLDHNSFYHDFPFIRFYTSLTGDVTIGRAMFNVSSNW